MLTEPRNVAIQISSITSHLPDQQAGSHPGSYAKAFRGICRGNGGNHRLAEAQCPSCPNPPTSTRPCNRANPGEDRYCISVEKDPMSAPDQLEPIPPRVELVQRWEALMGRSSPPRFSSTRLYRGIRYAEQVAADPTLQRLDRQVSRRLRQLARQPQPRRRNILPGSLGSQVILPADRKTAGTSKRCYATYRAKRSRSRKTDVECGFPSRRP